MAMIELVDFNEIYSNAKKEVKKSTRRGRSKVADAEVVAAPVAVAAVAEVAPEAPEALEAPEATEAPEASAAPEADENNDEKEAE
jgi:large subunit ribosomal protein L17